MTWQTPKTNWQAADVVSKDDFNRIEGNIQELQDTKETPAGAQSKVTTHENKTSTHGATANAIANRIMARDGMGRAKVAAPLYANDIARKDTVDTAVTDLAGVGRTTQTVKGNADDLAAHKAESAIHKTSNVIRTETNTQLKVEVVSSSVSKTPAMGRIIFDTSQGKFFGGNGTEWV